jgi:uncharacterized delta-60 repeat protein
MELVVVRLLSTGKLDAAFGAGGIVRTSITETDPRLGMTVTIDKTGRIHVVAGRAALTIARYLDTGEPDSTFGQGGVVTTLFLPNVTSFGQSFVRGVAIDERPPIVDPNSPAARGPFPRRIIAAGTVRGLQNRFHAAVARYDSDGQLDPTFGVDGEVLSELPAGIERDIPACARIDAEGRIVLGGRAADFTFDSDKFAIHRYLADGSPDATFNGSGAAVTSFPGGSCAVRGVTITSGQRIVAAGIFTPSNTFEDWSFALARYLPDGKLDPTFGNNGRILTTFGRSAFANCVTVDHKNRIVAAGNEAEIFTGRSTIARYHSSDGSLDTTFGESGKVIVDFNNPQSEAFSVVADLNDRLIAVGHAHLQFALARLREDGGLDSTFGNGDGKVRLELVEGQKSAAFAVTLDEKDRIIVAGVIFPPGEEPKMPNMTASVAIQDANISIGGGETSNDVHFPPFDLPGLSGGGILLFRFRPSGRSRLQVAFNSVPTQTFTLDSGDPRSFHEIYPLSALREENNELSMAVTPVSGAELGSVVISDVIILYGATPTGRL